MSKSRIKLALPALVVLALTSCAVNEVAPIQKAEEQRGSRNCINLNTATVEELAQLPGIGEVIARRVVDYRERNGAFRRREEIIIIPGMSEKKYRSIADLICV
jgi:competence ComEA-like helix-hairpin-helix protein